MDDIVKFLELNFDLRLVTSTSWSWIYCIFEGNSFLLCYSHLRSIYTLVKKLGCKILSEDISSFLCSKSKYFFEFYIVGNSIFLSIEN